METFTELIAAHNGGDEDALAALFELVYAELRGLALRQRPGRNDHTLSATGLVHEAYLKLQRRGASSLADRRHFFSLAKTVMRQVVTDHARERNAEKRGGGWRLAAVEVDQLHADEPAPFVLELDTLLSELAEAEPRLVEVVELKYFVGLSEQEIAEMLEVSTRTVQREWRRARGLLERRLRAC